MSMAKTNKGSCNHYKEFARKVSIKYPSQKQIDAAIDKYAEKVSSKIIKKLSRLFK